MSDLNANAIAFWLFGASVGTAICSSGTLFGASLGLAVATGVSLVAGFLHK